jgi:hypothetical protein
MLPITLQESNLNFSFSLGVFLSCTWSHFALLYAKLHRSSMSVPLLDIWKLKYNFKPTVFGNQIISHISSYNVKPQIRATHHKLTPYKILLETKTLLFYGTDNRKDTTSVLCCQQYTSHAVRTEALHAFFKVSYPMAE